MFFAHLPYITIIFAAVTGIVVSFVWHAPWAFGALWLKSKGWTDELLTEKKKGKSMAPVYAYHALANLVQAFVIAVLFNSLIIVGFSGVFLLALLVWVGFTVPVKLGDYLYGGDSFTYFLLSIGYQFAVILAMTFILAIFG